jgi:threonine dehydratase
MSACANVAAASLEAYESTRAHLRETPLEDAGWLRSAIAKRQAAAGVASSAADAGRGDGAAPTPPPPPLPPPPPPAAVYLKLESEQRSGSFKARGALNAVLRALRDDDDDDGGGGGGGDGAGRRITGFTTASTGNHALAMVQAVTAAAACARQRQQPPPPPLELRIFVAENADPTKLARLRAAASASADSGARCSVVVGGRDCCEAEVAARAAAATSATTRYISPYNDADVIAGQGSLAVELLSQLRGGGGGGGGGADKDDDDDSLPPMAVLIPVGGGGLCAGVASVLRAALGQRCAIYGCQPAANDVMRRSVAAGELLLDLPEVAEAPTLSDATAGGVERGSLTFSLCSTLVDRWIAVSEGEIADAMVSTLQHGGKLVEGAAACAVAAALRVAREAPEELAGRRVVVIACGGNVGVAALREALERGRAVEI